MTKKESFSGRKWPNSGGNCCFEYHHDYYSWCQGKKIKVVLGSSHKWTGNGPLTSLVRLLLDGSNILDRLSDKLLSSLHSSSCSVLSKHIIAWQNESLELTDGSNPHPIFCCSSSPQFSPSSTNELFSLWPWSQASQHFCLPNCVWICQLRKDLEKILQSPWELLLQSGIHYCHFRAGRKLLFFCRSPTPALLLFRGHHVLRNSSSQALKLLLSTQIDGWHKSKL